MRHALLWPVRLAQVSAAAQRVRELRAQVPVAVTRAAQQQLAEQRPAMSGVRAAQEAAAQAQDLFVPGTHTHTHAHRYTYACMQGDVG